MADVSEKLQELQESVQKLQMLKQIGAEKLAIEQEKEVFSIQQDILQMNENTAIDIMDMALPKKCKFCDEVKLDEQRLLCYEKNGDTCKKKEPKSIGVMNFSILKIIVGYLGLLGLLFAFLLFTNIFFSYFEGQRLVVFLLSGACLLGIFLLFRKPFKHIYNSL